MRTVVIALLFTLLSGAAFAQVESMPAVGMDVSFVSAEVNGVNKYQVRFLDNKQVELTINPNACSGTYPNMVCTAAEVSRKIVTPILYQNGLGADGSLELDLGDGLRLNYSKGGRLNIPGFSIRELAGNRYYSLKLTVVPQY